MRVLQLPLLTRAATAGEERDPVRLHEANSSGETFNCFWSPGPFCFVLVPCCYLREKGVFAITAVWLLCCFSLFVLFLHMWLGEGDLLAILPLSLKWYGPSMERAILREGLLNRFVLLCSWGVHENSAPLYQVIISVIFYLLLLQFLVNLFFFIYIF